MLTFQRSSSADTSGDATTARQGSNAQRSHVAPRLTHRRSRDLAIRRPVLYPETDGRTDLRLTADASVGVSRDATRAHMPEYTTTSAQGRASHRTLDLDDLSRIGAAINTSRAQAWTTLSLEGNRPTTRVRDTRRNNKQGFPFYYSIFTRDASGLPTNLSVVQA